MRANRLTAKKTLREMTDEEVVAVAQKNKMINPYKMKEAKNELLRRYKTFLDFRASAYRQAQMPPSAIKAQAYKLLFKFIETFDPKAKVKFNTYLQNSMIKLSRFVNQEKNIVRLPEQRFLQINPYNTAKNVLTGLNGREPSMLELADHLGWSKNQVERMETSLNYKPLSHSQSLESNFRSSDLQGDRYKETIEFVYMSSLSPQDQSIWDYANGVHGKKQLKAKDIASKLNISLDKVYASIRKTMAHIKRSM